MKSKNLKNILAITLLATGLGSSPNLHAQANNTAATFAGAALSIGSTNGQGGSARFNFPQGVAIDISGNVFVADADNHMIRKISPAGFVETFAGSTTPGSAGGNGTAARFSSPRDIVIKPGGDIFVADGSNNMIYKISPSGSVQIFAGNTQAGKANGNGRSARFNNPSGLGIDAQGNIYVADAGNNLIRKITPSGSVTTLAGSGSAGSANGAGTAASFNNPADVAVDVAGNVYVADFNNNKIRKISPNGVVATFSGTGAAGSSNSSITAATYNHPISIVVDDMNYVYISDNGNNKIRKIKPSGIEDLAGTGAFGAANGSSAATATFNSPHGIAISSNKREIFIADYANHIIRKLNVAVDHRN